MKSNKIKICGITDLEIANHAILSGADYLGFVAYKKSPRNISFCDSKNIISKLQNPIKTVAVVVDPEINEIKEIEDSGFNYIQLHGNESIVDIALIKKETKLKIVKAFGISNEKDLLLTKDYIGLCDLFLFDAKPEGHEMPGGNAKKFDWDLLKNESIEKEFFLSGGLDLINLEKEKKNNITSFFDVSSSIESSPGVKDKAKIIQFIDKIKSS